ncbi:cell surface glycoprotein 1-like [Schistocerca gregaria]|uniref:cell surface glycoprotein 1-like n=1 Tax=Schistocerca gregaria TaxID=7010 RepID=UPI00211E4701|nr:cell surface glycoprotein 1-like [Schistocerca gregaria]
MSDLSCASPPLTRSKAAAQEAEIPATPAIISVLLSTFQEQVALKDKQIAEQQELIAELIGSELRQTETPTPHTQTPAEKPKDMPSISPLAAQTPTEPEPEPTEDTTNTDEDGPWQQPPYDGPYLVVSRDTNTFRIMINGTPTTVAVDRIEPAFLDTTDTTATTEHKPEKTGEATRCVPVPHEHHNAQRIPVTATPRPTSRTATPLPGTTTDTRDAPPGFKKEVVTRAGRRVKFNLRYR